MASIELIRIDDRLIHGQVITKWVSASNSNRIVIVDDDLVKDKFLTSVYELAKPPGVSVEIMSPEQVAQQWKDNQLGSGKILMLFRYVEQVKKAHDLGLKIDKLQVAGLAAGPGRQRVYATVSLNTEDAAMLKQLSQEGLNIYFQMIPEESPAQLDTILKNYFKDLA